MALGLFQLHHNVELSLSGHDLRLFLLWSPPALNTGLSTQLVASELLFNGVGGVCSTHPVAHLMLKAHEQCLLGAWRVGYHRPDSEGQRLTVWLPTLETTATECHQWSDAGLPLYRHHLIYPLSFKKQVQRGTGI